MSTLERPYLRLHREPDPLASYVRPLERDYKHTAELILAGFPVGSGVVVDACHPGRSEDLRTAARSHGLEVVLDSRSLDLSTPGGIERAGVAELPWSTGEVDTPTSFASDRILEYAESLAAAALEHGASAVLAPTHYLGDPLTAWIDIDLQLARRLRAALDAEPSGRAVRVYYTFASSFNALRSEPFATRVVQGLQALSDDRVINAVWLRVNNFGTTTAGPITLPRYVSLARRFHSLGVPIVGERTGTVGIGLLALGAVAGIESGITHGERFSIRDLKKSTRPPSGGYSPRTYLPAIGVFLKREDAAVLLNTRGVKGSFGCQERCCRVAFRICSRSAGDISW